MTDETGKCSICGDDYIRYGHNPQPLKDVEERCCNFCNTMFVIPARLGVRFEGDNLPQLARILRGYDTDSLMKWFTLFGQLSNMDKLGKNKL